MTEAALALSAVNAMPADAFIASFGDIAEDSPWVAAAAARARPFGSREVMIAAFAAAVQGAAPATQLALLRAHPDLAGRAAVAGDIGDDSRREQAGAGLDRLTPEEFARFTELNHAYRKRFGIPFILAVKGATKYDILAGFARRSGNDGDTELRTALDQVARIMRFRIEARVREA